MRNKLWLFILGVVFFSACEKEETLAPTNMKNWNTIEYRDGMDEVDTKIYHLYDNTGIAVFYNDTLGREDRGYRNVNGDTIWYYEVLQVGFDMTEGENERRTQWSRVNVSSTASKRELLPILEWMEDAFQVLDAEKMNIPAILIVDSLFQTESAHSSDYVQKRIIKGFSYIAVSKLAFSEDPEVLSEYTKTLVNVICASQLSRLAQNFYNMLEMFMGIDEPWGQNYTRRQNSSVSAIAPEYYSLATSIYSIENSFEADSASLQGTIDMLKGWGWTSPDMWEPYEKRLAELIANKNRVPEMKEELEEMRPEKWGLIDTEYATSGGSSVMMRVWSKEEDLQIFWDELLTATKEDFYERYGKYPNVTARYESLRNSVIELGVDLDVLFE
ncbi:MULTISPECIES: hypothetical protein [Butyricimonas]|uniref:hypothetical protein n=1 Tax=Butyricimonas TaxID=574697 RepID=UPI0011DD54CD|nr:MULTISPECIES: hypothetical protein [Butyricimonas]